MISAYLSLAMIYQIICILFAFKQQDTCNIAANELTLADVIFFPQLAVAVRCGYPIEKWPRLSIYFFFLLGREKLSQKYQT